MGQPKLSMAEIRGILNSVKFLDRSFLLMKKGDGYLIQMEYMEADVFHPEKGPVPQRTRKWYVSPFSTETEVVETCWAMVLRSQQHVASEHFRYRGRQIYSQHISVNARIEILDEFHLDGRIPPMVNK